MGKASRRRQQRRTDRQCRNGDGVSKLYRATPSAVIADSEEVLRAYTEHRGLRLTDPAVLAGWDAIIYAESAALEALSILADQRDSTADLYFAELLDEPEISHLTPVMPALLSFLRARLAEQDPVLRLEHDTPRLALTLLLLAAHALRQATDAPAGSPQVAALVDACLDRLARDPLNDRLPAGDLCFALSSEERQHAPVDRLVRDEIRKIRNKALPPKHVVVLPDQPPLLVLELGARPDIQDLLRILETDPPADGADTANWWQLLPLPHQILLRLQLDWLDPVRAQLVLLLDADTHRDALTRIADHGCLDITAGLPDDPATSFFRARVLLDGNHLADLLHLAETRRAELTKA
ncbi:hypothetical protein [Streptacidiphilus anmyonensis]|uniref:hypothetical protein n=1 Tax=Streptacidiphilus anmyonensis TaxID=405782 RepID=UPI0005AA4ED6|nr:hypothetical protein [Streptacidiphilus anmyonensis]